MRKVLALMAVIALITAPVVYGAADENFIGPTITKNKINVRGDIRAGDDLIVVDDASIGGDLAVGGDLDITGDVIFDGNMDINAGLDVDTPIDNLIGIQFTTVTDAAAGEIGITAGQSVDIDADGDDVLINAADDIVITGDAADSVVTITTGATGSISVEGGAALNLDGDAIGIGDATDTVTVPAAFNTQSVTNIDVLTASKPVFTDASKNLTSTGTLGADQGGTGIASPTDHAVLVGSGAAAMDAVGVGADNEVLCGVTSGDPTFRSLADADVPAILTISGGTVNDSIIGGSTPAAITGTTITGVTFTDESASLTAGVFSGIVDLGSVTTADINAGTFDGVVGGTAPAAGSFTTIVGTGVDINPVITPNTSLRPVDITYDYAGAVDNAGGVDMDLFGFRVTITQTSSNDDPDIGDRGYFQPIRSDLHINGFVDDAYAFYGKVYIDGDSTLNQAYGANLVIDNGVNAVTMDETGNLAGLGISINGSGDVTCGGTGYGKYSGIYVNWNQTTDLTVDSCAMYIGVASGAILDSGYRVNASGDLVNSFHSYNSSGTMTNAMNIEGAHTNAFALPASGTDPVADGAFTADTSTGRIAITVGGDTRYLYYYD